ncbi:MFS transporter [Acinetobacter vivianii]|uniref:MFS transporter n=1 Tax=Acinetobacter vivianii TaxID=1776742 RepID=UPI002DBD87F7|nr:MFS transporter [Acinetobacter vivianii]MEB6668495.1 MFS transporter [Acinetobacter vivianii]
MENSTPAELTALESNPSQGNWFALLSVTFSAFALVTGEFLAIGVLNDIARDFQISVGTAGLTVSLTAIVGMFAAVLIPISAKTMDRRSLLLMLTLLMIIANLLTAFAPNFMILLFGRIILGVAVGGFWATAVALSGRLAPPHLPIAKATAWVAFGVTLASVLGVPMGTWLAQYNGWQTSFTAISLMGILLLIFQYLYLPQLKPSSSLRWKELPTLVQHPAARKGLIIFLFMGFAHFAAYSYFSAFFKHQVDFSDSLISRLLLVYGIAGIFGNVFAGYLGQINIRYTFAVSGVAFLLAFLALPLVGANVMLAIVLTALWGFAYGIIPTAVNIWMFTHAPEAVEKGMPMVTLTFLILIALGSMFGGIIVDHFDGSILFFAMLPLVLCSLILIFTLARGLNNPKVTYKN